MPVNVTITGPIQLTRGLRANLPTVALIGQAFFCTDTGEVFIWNGSAMVGPAAAQATEIVARIAAVAAEATARANADTTEATARAAETTRATGAEATLTTNLAAEVTRATNAEALKATAVALTAETSRAQAAEALLASITALNAEVTRATAAEATKQNIINFVEAEVPAGQGSGVTSLPILHAPGGSLRVFRNGVRQMLATDYTVSSTTLTLVLALSATDVIALDYRW